MSGHLLAVLILMTSPPQQGEVRRQEPQRRISARGLTSPIPRQRVVRRRPDPPPGGQVVGVATNFDGQQIIHYVTITMPGEKKARDDDEDEDEDEDEEPRPRPMVRLNLQAAILERENLDLWVFDDDGGAEQHWKHLEQLLEGRIASDSRGRTLTPAQKARLRVAGKGDIKRFLDQVEEERTQFEKERQSWRTGFAALRRLDPLAKIYAEGPFGAESLYAKTLRRIKAEPSPGERGPRAVR